MHVLRRILADPAAARGHRRRLGQRPYAATQLGNPGAQPGSVDRLGRLASGHRAVALYLLIYAATVLLSLPEAAVVTVAGGLLFGTLSGGILAVLGSSAGAIALFLAVRYQLADAIAARRGKFLDAVRQSLRRDGFSYLLAIRLVPAFPFWLVNLAAALSGMRLLPYAAATVLGIMPATFIYASIGAGLGDVLSAGGRPDLAVIFSPRILAPLVGLAVLSLLPVAWRRWKRSDA